VVLCGKHPRPNEPASDMSGPDRYRMTSDRRHASASITSARWAALVLSVAIISVACSSETSATGPESNPGGTTKPIDYNAIGLWNDGPCDPARPSLTIGLMTVFQSPVISEQDEATALEASATAFNARGGANGGCIKVVTCDDGANADQSVECVRKIDAAGVVATVNDLGTAGQADVSAAMAAAKIPRIASNVSNVDWGDENAYPIDGSGTGLTFVMPQALLDFGVKDIGIVRVDLAAAAALKGLLVDTYKSATFPVDIPVPAGTTDYGQFILAAQNGGAQGVMIALGPQEITQLLKAGQQLDTKLKFGVALGSLSQASVRDLGDFSQQSVFLWSYPPATFDLPVYTALRSDLAASGDDALQPANLQANPMRSWIGLYALLKMIRDAKLTSFTRDNITNLLKQAKDVPMLGIFGDENWTPSTDHSGLFKRVGTSRWVSWRYDPNAPAPDGVEGGNFVQVSEINFDKVLCGSIFGAPGPC
jgi:ABC-type branched-subunit amino acid transport system substrate-binding protein